MITSVPAIPRYSILDKIAEGGMGVVYRARDTRLERTVALKLLPVESVGDPESRDRFVHEARAASSLNHPHIATVYDLDTAGEAYYIAMEYVPGRSLDRLIGRHGLPIDRALHLAIQIADALAAAHSLGIVHRDLKPGNILVTDKDSVKLVDFGLAKLVETDWSRTPTATDVHSPHTEEGRILGSIPYMSPEQAEGRDIDTRSDIFSFGAVLYEMLSGRRPFAASRPVMTLAAIVSLQPRPLSDLLPGIPPELERLVRRCLQKDREKRLQHMDDVKLALEEIREEHQTAKTGAGPASRFPRRLALAAAGGALAIAAAALARWAATDASPPREPVLTRQTSHAGLSSNPVLSPDGTFVAYASDASGQGNLDIWVQQVAGGSPVPLTLHPADDSDPSFTPDATQIVFRSERDGGGIYVVPTLGGTARLVAQRGRRPRFSPDGHWIAY